MELKLLFDSKYAYAEVESLESLTLEKLRFLFQQQFGELQEGEVGKITWKDQERDWVLFSELAVVKRRLAQVYQKDGLLRFRLEKTSGDNVCSLDCLSERYAALQDSQALIYGVPSSLAPPARILVLTKPMDPGLVNKTRELVLWLLSRSGIERVWVCAYLAQIKRFQGEKILKNYGQDKFAYWSDDMPSSKDELVELIITMGGDGTVLFASHLFQHQVPPILPFHLGSLGFLTVFDYSQRWNILEGLIPSNSSSPSPNIYVCIRMRILCQVYRRKRKNLNNEFASTNGLDSNHLFDRLEMLHNQQQQQRDEEDGGGDGDVEGSSGSLEDEEEEEEEPRRDTGLRLHRLDEPRSDSVSLMEPNYRAEEEEPEDEQDRAKWEAGEKWRVLNEVVVDRGAGGSMCQVEVFVGTARLTTFLADGLVVATSTGSTAYNMSAGGSLVHPGLNTILVTPICPHALTCRPMLLPAHQRIRLRIPMNARSTAWASFDGRHRIELRRGDEIVITASRFPLPTISRGNPSTDWFRGLRQLLRWNERQKPKAMMIARRKRNVIPPPS